MPTPTPTTHAESQPGHNLPESAGVLRVTKGHQPGRLRIREDDTGVSRTHEDTSPPRFGTVRQLPKGASSRRSSTKSMTAKTTANSVHAGGQRRTTLESNSARPNPSGPPRTYPDGRPAVFKTVCGAL